jgi:isopentenyldiphosphate isomerase
MESSTTTLLPRALVSDADVDDCAALFSGHYGTWSARGARPGARIALSPARLREACLFDDACGVVLHRDARTGALLGHAFFRKFDVSLAPGAAAGAAVWVTQLVVAEGARGRRVATALLLRLCARDLVAFGLLSSHPHAVRALEHAAARRVDVSRVAAAAAALQAAARVPYFRKADIDVAGGRCVVRSGFFVDHAGVDAVLADYARAGRPFELGPLGEGEEFLAAVVFADAPAPRTAAAAAEEHFDVLDAHGALTGATAPRSVVHREGLFHRAVHTWLFSRATGELLLQRRAACKDSWAGRLDISSAGHVSAGGESRASAGRELEEELGVALPAGRFRFLFTHFEALESVQRGRPFINREFNDVYLVEVTPAERAALDPRAAVCRALPPGWAPTAFPDALAPTPPLDGFRLQDVEVSAVEWRPAARVEAAMRDGDDDMVPCSDFASYSRLFDALR